MILHFYLNIIDIDILKMNLKITSHLNGKNNNLDLQ